MELIGRLYQVFVFCELILILDLLIINTAWEEVKSTQVWTISGCLHYFISLPFSLKYTQR